MKNFFHSKNVLGTSRATTLKLKKHFLLTTLVAILGIVGVGTSLAISGIAREQAAEASSDDAAEASPIIVLSTDDLIEINQLYTEYLNDVASGKSSDWPIIPNKYQAKSLGSLGTAPTVYGFERTALPSAYSLLDEYSTPVKNQGAEQLCWAYALSTVIESNLKKTKGIDYEFSPRQLDYITASTSPYQTAISAISGSPTPRAIGDGGNFIIGGVVLGGQRAPMKSSRFFAQMKSVDRSSFGYYRSYDQYNNAKLVRTLLSIDPAVGSGSRLDFEPYLEAMPESAYFDLRANYVVTDFTAPNVKDSNIIERIKNSILDYGAVYTGVYKPDDSSGICYDAETKTIIDKGVSVCGQIDHAMAIVGWDDSHEYPGGTGAFLLQNSWGSGLLETYEDLTDRRVIDESDTSEALKSARREFLTNYDTDEYVWMSYDFATVEDTNFQFGVVENTKLNDYKRIYDIIDAKSTVGITNASGDTIAIERTFTTESASEPIRAVGVGTLGIYFDADFKIIAYLDRDATGAYERLGEVTLAQGEFGQHLIELATPIDVSGNFRIKLEITSLDETIYVNVADIFGDLVTDVYTGTYIANDPDDPDDLDVVPEPEQPEQPEQPEPEQPEQPEQPEDPEDPEEPTPEPSEEDVKVPDTNSEDEAPSEEKDLKAPDTGFSTNSDVGPTLVVATVFALVILPLFVVAKFKHSTKINFKKY